MSSTTSALEHIRTRFRQLVAEAELLDADVTVLAKPLSPEEAIGTPGRRDFPILVGKERVIEASLAGAKGHAFTDSPQEYLGSLREVIELALDTNGRRAVYVASLNAALRRLDMIHGTVHCRDDDPEQCAREVADRLLDVARQLGDDGAGSAETAQVGFVGLNPALAERLVATFGAEQMSIVDLNPDNIGTRKFGVEIGDGARDMEALVDRADVLLVTGTTLVNGTFDAIWSSIQARGKRGILYGVTAAGVAALQGFERLCPYGRDA